MKVCYSCGFENSEEKNYCDRCGTSLSLAFAIPPAERLSSLTPPPLPEGLHIPPAAPAPTGAVFARLRRKVRRQNLLILLLILALAAVAGTFYHNSHSPQKMVLRVTAQYLEALRHQDFQAAYSLLSQESKNQYSPEEFQAQREDASWSWSDARIARIEPAAAVVKYRLSIQGQAPSDDFIFFFLEENRWVRPYNWNLLKKAEAALDQNTPELALIFAQAAAHINPRDPMAQGYLCEAIYYSKAPVETQKACVLALDLSQTYPSKLSPKSLYRLHAILADTYKNSLGKYAEAAQEYDALLAFKDLSAQDKCDILLSRAEALFALDRKPQAQGDLDEAFGLCAKPEDLDYIRTHKGRRRNLRPLDL